MLWNDIGEGDFGTEFRIFPVENLYQDFVIGKRLI